LTRFIKKTVKQLDASIFSIRKEILRHEVYKDLAVERFSSGSGMQHTVPALETHGFSGLVRQATSISKALEEINDSLPLFRVVRRDQVTYCLDVHDAAFGSFSEHRVPSSHLLG